MLYQTNHSHVINEIIDGEAIIINLASGNYYSLDSVGSQIWALLEQPRTADEVAAILVGRYDASEEVIRRAVENLLERLAVEELVEREDDQPSPASSVPSHPPTNGRLPFKDPTFEKFTDMQDLILLDPVHEVGSRGWPHAAERHANS